jgi:AraC family transcriptional regulator of adaptative response/methylated-DNA-[protein]-cysteine methyltransferase
MEQAFLEGDRSFDGLFVAGVRTTGIFCRPSCPARKPKPENLEYFATPAEACARGYRACLRCHPQTSPGERPAWLQPLFQRLEAEPDTRLTATDLKRLGLEPARVRRWFQHHLGLSFAEYARHQRLGRALTTLQQGGTLDAAALGHGFESHSGFRDAFSRHFGTPPGAARTSACLKAEVIASPLGPLLIAASDLGICLLEFSDPERVTLTLKRLRQRVGLPWVPGEHPHLNQLKNELAAYFAGQLQIFTVPLHAPGTAFQERVWAGLRQIPFGATASYAELAHRLGCPNGQRAVGLANGANRIAIVIPCHRVVNSGGALGGYGGGLWRKLRLLELERPGRDYGTHRVPRTESLPHEPVKSL